MKKFFYPESVAVFGVSDSQTNLARVIVQNLIRSGFKGAVYPIGRNRGVVEGKDILLSVEEMSATPDVAIILMPARSIPDVMDACGRRGIRNIIILSGGFSESGEKGRDVEGRIREVADRWGIKLVGPNCQGIANMENAFVSFFIEFDTNRRKRGGVSMLSQSGGIIVDGVRLFGRESIGINKLISMGNKLNQNECDYLEFLASDPESRTIILYLEGISDGRRLMEIAYGTDKPVIVLKSNRSSTSNQAARFHTSALAGDDVVADFAFRQAGMHRVQDMQELLDVAKMFSLPLVKGENIAAFGRSGGQAVMIADALDRYGFRLARLSDEFFDMVRQGVRAGVTQMTNPLDVGDILDVGFYERLMEKALLEPGVDGLVISHVYLFERDIEPSKEIIKAAKTLSDRHGKPVVFCMVPDEGEAGAINREIDFPVFSDVGCAVKSLAVSRRHHLFQEKKSVRSLFESPRQALCKKKKVVLENAGGIFRLLETHRIPTVSYAIIENEREALVQAKRIGYPVALKTASLEIVHKTESGGVALDIRDAVGMKTAFGDMMRKLSKTGKDAGEFIVQKMAPSGLEVFVGGKQDAEFGPVILFGLGGIFVEVFRDVVMRIAPVDMKTAREMTEEIRGSVLLKGFRGRPPSDTASLARCIVNASRMLVEHPEIKNLDINPLIVYEKGKGCVAVDAKIGVG